MIALWFAYAVLVGTLVSAAAFGAERVAALWTLPRRLAWVAAMAVTLVSPIGVMLWPASTEVATASATGAVVFAGAGVAPAVGSGVIESPWPWAQFVGQAAPALSLLNRPLLLLWAATSLLLALALVRSALHLRRQRRQWERRQVDDEDVLVTLDMGPAALAGGRPGIVLPSWTIDLDRPLRRLVLRHEREHLLAGDPWLLLAGIGAIVLAPWNLALWCQLGRLRLAVEVDCDRRVLRAERATAADVERYGLLLMALGQRGHGLLRVAVPALSEPVTSLERRIAAMTDRTPSHRWLRASLLAAGTLTLAVIACVTPSPNRVVGPDGSVPEPESAVSAPTADTNTTYFEFQVEKPVSPLNNAPPSYPARLRQQKVSGTVMAQFVVGPDGTADLSTFRVLQSPHDLFTAAVRNALPKMRFEPAEIGGRRVKQLVQQPFVFAVETPSSSMLRPRSDSTASATLRRGTVTGMPAPVEASGPPSGEQKPGYFEFQVEQPARLLNTVQPSYPAALRQAGVSGSVMAQFVVDTTGLAEVSTFRVLESTDPLFTAAVRNALPKMRFEPAQVDGHKVRQLMQVPFNFALQ